jgi:hypothetical protein
LKVGDLIRVLSRKFFDCGQTVEELDVGIYLEEKNGHVYLLGKLGRIVGYQVGVINDKTRWEIQGV